MQNVTYAKGVDYNKIFFSYCKTTSIIFFIAIAIGNDLEVEKMNVKTTFILGDLEEDIYIV